MYEDHTPMRRAGSREGGGRIRLFRANLDEPPLPLEELEASLTSAERERAGRFGTPQLRSRWITARGLLRHLLARELARERACDPADVPLRVSDRGKPFVPDEEVSFNLSHSGPHLLIALSPAGRVGVDVEVIHPVRDLEGLVRRFLAPREVETILSFPQEGPDGGRLGAFFRTWVRKEALLKGMGLGIGAGLDNFEVTPVPLREGATRELGDNLLLWNGLPEESSEPWQVRSVVSPQGVVAAVAWDSPELSPGPSVRMSLPPANLR